MSDSERTKAKPRSAVFRGNKKTPSWTIIFNAISLTINIYYSKRWILEKKSTQIKKPRTENEENKKKKSLNFEYHSSIPS